MVYNYGCIIALLISDSILTWGWDRKWNLLGSEVLVGNVRSLPTVRFAGKDRGAPFPFLVRDQYQELRPLLPSPSEPCCFWVSHSSWSPIQQEASHQEQQSCRPADLFESLPDMVNPCHARGFLSSEAEALGWDVRNSRAWLADAGCVWVVDAGRCEHRAEM